MRLEGIVSKDIGKAKLHMRLEIGKDLCGNDKAELLEEGRLAICKEC